MLKKTVKIIVWTVVAALACFLLWKYSVKPFMAKMKGAVIKEADLAVVKRANISSTIKLTGSVMAKKDIDVTAKPDGVITEWYVKEGDKVKKGDKIVLIKPGKNEFDDYKPMVVYSPDSGEIAKCTSDSYSNREKKDFSLPVLGTTIKGSYNSGESATCLVRIIDTNHLMTAGYVTESQISKIKSGMKVKVEAYTDKKISLDGVLTKVSKTMESSSRNYYEDSKGFLVLTEFDNKDNSVFISLDDTVVIPVETKNNILTIPLTALFERDDKYYVFKYLGDNKKELVEIKTGISDEDNIEVAGGLSEGDRVLTTLPYGEVW